MTEQVPPRRRFIAQAASIATLIPVVASSTAVARAPDHPAPGAESATPPQLPEGYLTLGPTESGFVEALVNVMCPADEYTPNGVDCGLAVFMDRQLAGEFGLGGRMYMQGPWQPGKPQQGYQLPLKPVDFFKSGIVVARDIAQQRYGKPFEQLSPQDADAFLADIAAGKVADPRLSLGDWFNLLVYPLFQQACFADPIYGGNRGKVFWRMVGYPGLPAFHTQDMVQYRGKPYPGASQPKSIQDFS